MSNRFLITARGEDRVGLIATLTGALFDHGANLAECAFHNVGSRFDFRALADFPKGVSPEDVSDILNGLEILSGADIVVMLEQSSQSSEDDQAITHTVIVDGEDRPGLVARISEVLTEYGANIVRMHTEQHEGYGEPGYLTRFRISVGPEREVALDNALSNMAGSMRLTLAFEAYSRSAS